MSDPTHAALPRRSARTPGLPHVWMLLCALGLTATVLLWIAPEVTSSTQPRPFRTSYTFDHDVPLPPNPVYEDQHLQLGDPIFLAVIDEVEVSVDYLLGSETDVVEITEGELRATVELVSTAGWERTLSTSEPVAILGRQARAMVPVDFAAARVLATEVDAATGVTGALTVRIRATALVDGSLQRTATAPTALDAVTAADIQFALGASTAELVAPNRPERDAAMDAIAGIAPGTAGASALGTSGVEVGELVDPMHPGTRELVRMVPTEVVVPASVVLLGRSIELPLLRVLAAALTALFAILATAGLWSTRRAGRSGAVAAIAAQHHGELVPAARLPAVPADRIIDLSRFDDLLRISRDLDLPLVVWQHDDLATYAVTDGLTRYRFEIRIDAPRDATITSRSVTTVPGRRADDGTETVIYLDTPITVGEATEVLTPRRRASDVVARAERSG